MYQINVGIRGTAPLLQHKYGIEVLTESLQAAKRSTAQKDYSKEWLKTMYINQDGYLFQPASHLEGAMVKSAAKFKLSGKGRMTFKQLFRGYIYVQPDEVLHLRNGQPVPAPDEELMLLPTEYLSVNIMRVNVQRQAVARSRLQIAPGWELNFCIEVHDDVIRSTDVSAILADAGHSEGIGDFRPRYGRFEIVNFQTQQ